MGIIYIFLFLSVYSSINCERLHEQIYSTIKGGSPCFRRLNGTHQAGCSSSQEGTVGVVQLIKDLSDAQWIVQNGTAGPYMAVVDTALFYHVINLFMKHPDNVAGIVVYANQTISTESFTQESQCPNEYYSSPGSQCSKDEGGIIWNEKGTGLLRRDIPFPILFIPQSRDKEINKIEECYTRFNLQKDNQNGNPLCSIQISSFMHAAVNSEVCIRRSDMPTFMSNMKVCDPLGGSNVIYPLFPRQANVQKTKNESITLVTARIDSASLFDGIAPGAASSVVGMTVMVAAAAALAKLVPTEDADLYSENVLWTFFNGEAFDYIGSQSVAYDLKRNAWPSFAPLSVENIKLHVEVGQIGGSISEETWPIFALTPSNNSEVSSFIDEFSKNMNVYNTVVTQQQTENLPPSSLHSFRRILKNETESGQLPELLLVDHSAQFTNMFYHSAMDDYRNIGYLNYHNISISKNGTFMSNNEIIKNGIMTANEPPIKIARIATALSRTLYQRITGNSYTGNVEASAHLVDEMLYCFLYNQNCKLMQASEYGGRGGAAPAGPGGAMSTYVSVDAWAGVAPVFLSRLLALLTGQPVSDNVTVCTETYQQNFSHHWLRGWNDTGVCILSTSNFTKAISPAFLIPDYDMKSGLYSTWTESIWPTMSARVFVSAGGGGARLAAIFGILVTALSILLTYWLQKHKDVIFVVSPVSAVARDEATSGILRSVNC